MGSDPSRERKIKDYCHSSLLPAVRACYRTVPLLLRPGDENPKVPFIVRVALDPAVKYS